MSKTKIIIGNDFIYAPVGTPLEESKIMVELPKTTSFQNGTKMVTSNVYYDCGDSKKRKIRFGAPKQQTLGLNGNWPMNITEESEKTMENMKGLQMSHNITSADTIDEPTPQEQCFIDNLTIINTVSVKAMARFANEKIKGKDGKSESPLPIGARSLYNTAKSDGDESTAFKPTFDNAKVVKDKLRPGKMYAKFSTFKKKDDAVLTSRTPVFTGKQKIDVFSILIEQDKYHFGDVVPVFEWGDIYWGAHGTKAYGGSARITVYEMNYTPNTNSVHTRMLDDDDNDGDFGDFVHPMTGVSNGTINNSEAISKPTEGGVVDSDFVNEDKSQPMEVEEKPATPSAKKHTIKKTTKK